MVPEDLLFWMGPIDRDGAEEQQVLCQRHANDMVVPRGWTLDDRRERDLHLFNTRRFDRAPPPAPAATRSPSTHAAPSDEAPIEQLQIDGTGDIARPTVDPTTDELDDGPSDQTWSPRFNEDDDLDGLLDVDSPLLSRAFRGERRSRRR